MRRAYQDVGWVLSPGGALAGLSLGFDRRAEHVQGIAPLLEKLGVEPPPYQDGLLDRQVANGLPPCTFLSTTPARFQTPAGSIRQRSWP